MLAGRSASDDRGETLLEVLISVVILGFAAVSILGAFGLTTKVSGIDRRQSTAATAVRNFAEKIQTDVAMGNYNENGTYNFTVPGDTGLTAGVVPGTAECATRDSAKTDTPVWASCPQSGGIQRMQIQVSSVNLKVDERIWIYVRRPCVAGGVGC